LTERAGASEEPATPEFGLFIIWSNAVRWHAAIVDSIAAEFEIRGVHRVSWSRAHVTDNYNRFYHSSRLTPPYFTHFEAQKGLDPFTVITVLDRSPQYSERETGEGKQLVNGRLFDLKARLRSDTAAGKAIHATQTAREARRDLYMLFGMTIDNYLASHPGPWQGTVEQHDGDVPGADGWRSLGSAFAALDALVNYAVLRNFESLPGSQIIGAHDDVDVLVDDYWEAARILNARPRYGWVPKWGGRFQVRVGESQVIFDIRFVGDGYFDPGWQRQVLDRRVRTAGGVWAVEARDYFETLAYHALLHKPRLSDEYRSRLIAMAQAQGRAGWTEAALSEQGSAQALLRSITQGTRTWVRPHDITVFYNYRLAGRTFPMLRRKLAALRRKLVIRIWPARGQFLAIRRRVMQWFVLRFPALRRVRETRG
jgi:hypothetical protein